MKVQHIENINQNINTKSLNKSSKIGMYSLIASTSLFMFANAFDTFEPQTRQQKTNIAILQTIASVLGIFGTAIGLRQLEQYGKAENNE